MPLNQRAKEKTAFRTPFDLYHFQIMPFGLGRIQESGLTLNPKKCAMGKKVRYLGYVTGSGVIRPQVENVESIHSCAAPTTKKKVRTFFKVGWDGTADLSLISLRGHLPF